ncbi:integral membrane protein (TIGR00529 family) [Bacilli bacterium PM5-3]|nr:integral membrane protein (TIGR00529 family) [Bacilli bacterium PM5-3]MDH6603625.1 integral membrane protein (TIGR00529 family) [Bacilli bacterium PM5-9]
MEIYILAIVFLAIIVTLFVLKKPLMVSILAGIILSIILYQIPLDAAANIIKNSITSQTTISVLLVFYIITLLQRMMQKEDALTTAQQSIEKLVNNRRLDAIISPTFMGLLPSASAVYLAGAMVETSCKDDLSAEDKTVIASYFRHVAESFLPTYPAIIIAISLTGVNLNTFILAMIPMVIVYVLLGYFFLLRKLPLTTFKQKVNIKKELSVIISALFPIIAVLILILAFNIPAQYAAGVIVIIYAIYKRYSINEMIEFIKSAFEPKVLITTALIFVFKDIITYMNVIELLPSLLNGLPIPIYLTYGIIFFFSAIILGNSGANVIILPLAFSTIPDAGLPLLIYLNCIGFISMQVSPTHLCLFMACEYFKTDILELFKRSIPMVVIFLIVTNIYYLLLNLF